MKSRVTRNRALVLLPVIIFSFACSAVAGDGSRTYWVSPNGQATWADARSDIPLSGAACCSLSTANTSARAGDMAYLRGGTCTGGPKSNSSISPSNSGTEGKMITFSAYNNEPVIFQDTPGFPSGVFLKNKSYIKVHGITFKRSECMLTILGGSHNEISHCTFDDSLLIPRVGRPRKSRIAQNSRNNWIHHCTFSRSGAIGPPPVFDDLGGLMTIGNPNSGVGNRPADDSSHNLIEITSLP